MSGIGGLALKAHITTGKRHRCRIVHWRSHVITGTPKRPFAKRATSPVLSTQRVALRRGASPPCASSLLISVESLSRLCRADARASDTALNRSAEPPEGAGAGASQARCGDHPAITFLTPPP